MAKFIGESTQNFDFNFLGKILGSMVECPLKCYWARAKDLLLPIDARWKEFNQENYDKLKNQDNISALMDATVVGEKPQFLIEIDLNGVCKNLYNNDTSLMKQNLKNITLDIWAKGIGSYEGCMYYYYDNSVGTLMECNLSNFEDFIEKCSNSWNDSETGKLINDKNIIYIVLCASEASSEQASALHMDYVNLRCKLKRQPEIIKPLNVELGEEWSILIKGFSPNWDNNSAPNLYPRVLEIKDKLVVSYRQDTKVFYFQDMKTNVLTALPQFSFKKFQSINFLVTQDKDKKITLYAHENGGVIKKISTLSSPIVGMNILYILQSIGNERNGDAFIDNIYIKCNYAFTDNEADVVLKGNNTVDALNTSYNELADLYKNPNLCHNFKHPSWAIHPNATVSEDGNTLTLIATGNYQGSSIDLPILPNNKYRITANITGSGNAPHIALTQRYNTTVINPIIRIYDNTGSYTGNFVTSSSTNRILISCQNGGATGTIKFSDIVLTRIDY